MNTNLIWTTDIAPSHIGMSFDGSAFGVRTRVFATPPCAQATVTGRLGKREASYPGTTAWRPPSC